MRTRWILFWAFGVIAGLYGLAIGIMDVSANSVLNAPATLLAMPVLFLWTLLPFSPASASVLTMVTVIAADVALGGLVGYAIGRFFEKRGR